MRNLLVLLGSLVVIVSTARGANPLQKLLLDGDKEPVSGGTIMIVNIQPGGGRVFVTAMLAGPGINTANDRAWLYGDAHSPSLLFREGQPMPVFSLEKLGNVTASMGPGGWYGLGIDNTTFNYSVSVVGNSSVPIVVARSGDNVPGTTFGMDILYPRNVVSEKQYTAFAYGLDAKGSHSAEYRTRTDGSLQLLCVGDKVMPELPADSVPQFILRRLDTPSTSLWTLGFNAPSSPFGSSADALYFSNDSGSTLLMKDNDPQPVTPAAGAASPRPALLNNDGSYVVFSNLRTSGNVGYGTAIYTGKNGSLALRRVPTQVFTDQPGYYPYLFERDTSVSGHILVEAELNGAGPTRYAIGLGDAESGFRTLVQSETAAPGIAGAQFGRFGIQSDQGLRLNSIEDVVFCATLAGAGVTSGNDFSVWFYNHATHSAELLAREGDSILVNGVLRTIGSLDHADPFFSAQGDEVIFKMKFTDNAQGLFSVAVPDPLSGSAVALFAAMVWTRRRGVC